MLCFDDAGRVIKKSSALGFLGWIRLVEMVMLLPWTATTFPISAKILALFLPLFWIILCHGFEVASAEHMSRNNNRQLRDQVDSFHFSAKRADSFVAHGDPSELVHA